MDKPRLIVDNQFRENAEKSTEEEDVDCSYLPKECVEALYNSILQLIDAVDFVQQAIDLRRIGDEAAVDGVLRRVSDELLWARKSAGVAFQAAIAERAAVARRGKAAKRRAPRRGP